MVIYVIININTITIILIYGILSIFQFILLTKRKRI